MKYDDYFKRKQREFGMQFDASDLDPRFIPAFNSGERIRVKLWGEEIKTGTVGVTGGWRPSFLLMSRKSAIGSSILLNAHAEFSTEKVTRFTKV